MAEKEVLLINPNLMKPVVAPIAIDYLAGALKRQGIGVSFLDLSFSENPETDMRRAFRGRDFTAIGITVRNIDDSYFASQDFCLEKTKDVINLVKLHTRSPLVLGGVGYSIAPLPALAYCQADFGIRGEGEGAFPELVEALVGKRNPEKIAGLVLGDSCGSRINAPEFLDLNKVSFSRRDTVDNRRYYREGGMVGFETKRGCDQTCHYCADPVAKGRQVRVRAPHDVASELDGLLAQGIDVYHTCDSEFNVPPGHALDVCKEIVRRKLGDRIRWYAYATPCGFSDELARWMRKAGCVGIDFGVDSGNEKILKNLGRRHTSRDIREVAQRCRKHGFTFMYDLLLGGPGENKETLQETLDLMRAINPTRVGISLGIRIYPGTYFGEVLGRKVCSSQPGPFGPLEGGNLLRPSYYLSPALGDDVTAHIRECIRGDSRFFFGSSEDITENYNYNDNSALVAAIRCGYQGAFWDILRRLEEGH